MRDDVHFLHLEHAAGEIPAHFQDSVSIGILRSGACSLTTRSGAWFVHPGDVIVINALEPHAGRWETKLSHYTVLHIGRGWFERCMPHLDPGKLVDHTVWALPSLRDAVHDTLCLFQDRALTDARERQSNLTELLAHIASMPRDLKGVPSASQPSWVDGLKLAGGVQQLAGQTGQSRYSVYRRIRGDAGIGPARYLRFMRVAEAKHLIVSGVALADAAAQCGFADQSHFTRAFREAYGVPPQAFLASRSR